MVYPVLYLGGLFLRYFCHALTFGQFTAYQLVCDLVRAALMRGLRMAVERSHAEGILSTSGLTAPLCTLDARSERAFTMSCWICVGLVAMV